MARSASSTPTATVRPRGLTVFGLLLTAALVAAVLVWPVLNDEDEALPIGTSPLGATYRGDAARTGRMPGPGPLRAPRLAWRAPVGEARYAAPALAGDLVYVASASGAAYALAAGDGEVVWQVATTDYLSTPAVADGLVYFAGRNVTARDAATGAERWTFETDGIVAGSPVVVDGVVYVGAGRQDDVGQVEGRVYALDAANGDLVWEAPVNGYYHSAPAVAGGLVVLHTDQAGLFALDAPTGQLRWEKPVGVYESLPGGAAIGDDTVYVVGHDAAPGAEEGHPVLLALDAANGGERWRYDYEGAGLLRGPSPAVVDGTVYLGGRGMLYALDAATGQERWRAETGGDSADPVVAGGVVYVTTQVYGNVYGTVMAFDAATGVALWRVDVLDLLPTNPVVADGRVYAAGYNFDSQDGFAYAISGPTERADAASPVASPGGDDSATTPEASPTAT